ncbi:MAG: hypothetical protein KIT22_16560, partial [Verrucomicrobiae bacterium]|nr:hypothetical protein [Verrucomicrobiae bacterium]
DEHLKAGQESLRAVWAPVAPAARQEMDQLRERLRSELNPEQRDRFDAALQERFRKGPRPGDRGGNGPERRGNPEGGREHPGEARPQSPAPQPPVTGNGQGPQ